MLAPAVGNLLMVVIAPPRTRSAGGRVLGLVGVGYLRGVRALTLFYPTATDQYYFGVRVTGANV